MKHSNRELDSRGGGRWTGYEMQLLSHHRPLWSYPGHGIPGETVRPRAAFERRRPLCKRSEPTAAQHPRGSADETVASLSSQLSCLHRGCSHSVDDSRRDHPADLSLVRDTGYSIRRHGALFLNGRTVPSPTRYQFLTKKKPAMGLHWPELNTAIGPQWMPEAIAKWASGNERQDDPGRYEQVHI
jgi:hypothetical protein